MIAALRGVVIEKTPNRVVIDVNGIGFSVFVPISMSSALKLNESCNIKTVQIVKEDSIKLYGFLKEEQQQLFCTLIKISGIGPSIAMAVLSTMSSQEFYSAITKGDTNLLRKIPGVGPKMASRLLVELGAAASKSATAASFEMDEERQALEALISLGFKSDTAAKAIKEASQKLASSSDISALLKEALALLR